MAVAEISMRPANHGDCDTALLWRNHESTRKWFGDMEPVEAGHHREWFCNVLADPTVRMFAVCDGGTPVCHVRFNDRGNGCWEASITTDPLKRRRGYGTISLMLACSEMLGTPGVTVILANVKENNAASMGAFAKAGFCSLGLRDYGTFKSYEMRLYGRGG